MNLLEIYSIVLNDVFMNSIFTTGNGRKENEKNHNWTQIFNRKAKEWLQRLTKVKDLMTEAGIRKFGWATMIFAMKNDD